MSRFGSDKPDTRFGLELRDVSRVLRAALHIEQNGDPRNGSETSASPHPFAAAIARGGAVCAFHASDMAKVATRKDMDALFAEIKRTVAKPEVTLEKDKRNNPLHLLYFFLCSQRE